MFNPRYPQLPVLEQLPLVMWPCLPRTLDWVLRRPPSSRLWVSPPRFLGEPLRSWQVFFIIIIFLSDGSTDLKINLGCDYLVLLKPSSFPLQSDVGLIKIGDKVGASEATLLNMLNISPFSYGLIIQQVYDNGSVYSPEVLDITEASLHARFLEVRFSNTCHNSVTFLRPCVLLMMENLWPRVWGMLLVCVWRLATLLWLQCLTPSSMVTKMSWQLLWKPTTPSHWQTRYTQKNWISTLVQLIEETFNQRWKLKYGFACPHRSRPTLLILLRLLLRHLQQLLKLLQLQLLPRRRPRKNLKSQMMTWVLVCLTKANVIMNQ